MPARRIVVLLVAAAWSPAALAQADVLWTENAENGLAHVTPHTTGGYPLIQTDIVSQGARAFHLANPAFADNWFEIDQPIAVQADTKLFFQSRLGFATSQQVARVQASADGGSSWPIGLFSQAGTGDAEGAFSLKQIDLSSYASQTLQFRFYYDFTSGSAFTQTDSGIGWYVDDIQFADELEKSLYSIGNPSPDSQLYLEYINRARGDALVEAARLVSETAPGVQSAYNFFGIQDADIINQFEYYVANGLIDQHAQPLSFNAKLNQAAELHTQDMFNNEFQGHNSSGNPPAPLPPFGNLGDRANAVGYDFTALAENVFAYAESAAQGHAGFDVDWGDTPPGAPGSVPAFNGQGMQNPAGHRKTIHNGGYKEIGIGVVNGTSGPVGPQLVTQDFASPGNATFVTGVVYQDVNGNSFYDIGEGRSGVRVDVAGSAFYALSSDSGGYSVPVDGDGAHAVSFSGGGFGAFAATANVSGGRNVKIDYLATLAPTFTADFDSDGDVDGADLAQWTGDFGQNDDSDADDDNDSDGADFLAWQRQFGSGGAAMTTATAVPEPASAFILACGSLALIAAGRCRA